MTTGESNGAKEGGELKPCPYCDDTGSVHRADGEWMGACFCPAGLAVRLTDGKAYCGRCDRGPAEAPSCPHGKQCGLRSAGGKVEAPSSNAGVEGRKP